jgi:flavodoxin
MTDDVVNHPSHYTHYKGVEVIEITREMNFNLGNAVKYIARAGLKDPSKEIEDLQKAIFYVKDELARGVSPKDPDELESEWGDKVYELASQMSTYRQEAVEYICMGSASSLQYAFNFLDREIEELKSNG